MRNCSATLSIKSIKIFLLFFSLIRWWRITFFISWTWTYRYIHRNAKFSLVVVVIPKYITSYKGFIGGHFLAAGMGTRGVKVMKGDQNRVVALSYGISPWEYCTIAITLTLLWNQCWKIYSIKIHNYLRIILFHTKIIILRF